MLHSEERVRRVLLPLGLAVLAVMVRLRFPDVQDEALPMKKAFEMWGWDSGHVSLDPRTAGWPSLSFYVHLVLQHLHYWVGRLAGTFADRYDYFVAARLDAGPMTQIARSLSVAAAGVIVWTGARLALRLAGIAGALLSGLLLVVSPMLIDFSHLITPDILVALFAALAVDRIVAIQERGRSADYLWAGIWIGLGISSKYTPVLLLPAVFYAHWTGPGPRSHRGRPSLLDRAPWLAALAALAAFVLTSPYLVIDLPTVVRDVATQTIHMTEGHFGLGGQGGALYYFLEVLGPGLGWAGACLGLLGLVWGSVGSRGPWRVLIACIVPYYAGLALLQTHFPRYVLPLLMPLAVAAAGVVPGLRALPWFSSRARRVAVVSLVTLLALAPAVRTSWQRLAENGRPTTHRLASRFLQEAAATGRPRIAAEVLTVTLPSTQDVETLGPELLGRLSARQRAHLLEQRTYRIDRIPMYALQPGLSAFYYDVRHFTAHDYIVVSQAIRGRYLASPERFPNQVRFYQDLDRYSTLVCRFGPEEGARGAEIRIYRVPDDDASFARDRPELALDSAVILAEPVNIPDFVPFVEGVASAAHAKGRWAMAARYYGLLLEVGERAGMSDQERAELSRLVAALKARAVSGAAPLSGLGVQRRAEVLHP